MCCVVGQGFPESEKHEYSGLFVLLNYTEDVSVVSHGIETGLDEFPIGYYSGLSELGIGQNWDGISLE